MVISAQDPLCLANPLPAPLQTAGVWPCSQGKLWQRAHSGAPSPVAVWHRKSVHFQPGWSLDSRFTTFQ